MSKNTTPVLNEVAHSVMKGIKAMQNVSVSSSNLAKMKMQNM